MFNINLKKIYLIVGLLIIGFVGTLIFVHYAQIYYIRNVKVKKASMYISENWTVKDVIHEMKERGILFNINSFEKAVEKLRYTKVHPGHYVLDESMGNKEIITKLIWGYQDPVKVLIGHAYTKEVFAEKIAENLMFDSEELYHLLNDEKFLKSIDASLDVENFWGIFIANTYEFYWTSSPESFIRKMHLYFQRFMNKERTEKAKAIGLSPIEVVILSTIVDAETLKDDEMPRVAGLYLNRLKKGIKLQADPTVIYALKDFSIRRVLRRYLRVKSPYNTYLYIGLPPGPIRTPNPKAIDAVLNYEKHRYLFMCAKEDFSGYHNFAVTSREHERNARRFRQALNKRKIWR